MHDLPTKPKIIEPKGVKREKEKIANEQWQAARMFSKSLPSHFVSKKQRKAGWSYLLDQFVIISLVVSIPTAVLSLEVYAFTYIFDWLGFTYHKFL